MKNEWKLTTVGNIAPFTYGKSLPFGKRNQEGDIPVMGSNGLVGWHDAAVTDGPTIVIGRKGTVGAVHYVPGPCWPIDTTYFVTGDDAELVRFQYYALSALGLTEMNTHSAVPGLNREAAHARELHVPEESEQRRIAHILGTLDDKIDLNRRMNETLEEMARAIFTSWFVDYDPVRAKIDGRWRRGESLPGLPADMYDLFPARMVESELGEIPEGWEVRALGECLSAIVSGQRPRGGAVESGVPSIGAENIIGLGRYNFTSEKYVPVDFFAKLKARGADVRNGDVLLYKDGAHIGRKTYFDRSFPHSECAVNEHVFILRMQEPAAQRHLFYWLDQPWMTQEIVTLNSNSAQPGINQTSVRGLPLLVPPTSLLAAFDRMAGAMTDRVFANCHESRTLGALRDTLLPRLVSGEVGVGGATTVCSHSGEM